MPENDDAPMADAESQHVDGGAEYQAGRTTARSLPENVDGWAVYDLLQAGAAAMDSEGGTLFANGFADALDPEGGE